MASYDWKCAKCKQIKTHVEGNALASDFYLYGQGPRPDRPRNICKECDKARRRAATARKGLKQRPAKYLDEVLDKYQSAPYVKRPVNPTTAFIKYCPDGSWPADVYFNGVEFHTMLEDGYLTAGMLVEIAEIEYIVLGKQLESQWMIPA